MVFPNHRPVSHLVAVLMLQFLLAAFCLGAEPETSPEPDAPDTLTLLEEWSSQLGWDMHYKSALAKTSEAVGKDDSWVAKELTDAPFDWLHQSCYSGVLGAKAPHVLSALCIEQMPGSWTTPCVIWYLRTDEGAVVLTDIHLPVVPGKEKGEWAPAPCQRIAVPPRLAAAFEAIISGPAAWRSGPEIGPSTGSVVFGVSLFKDGKSYQTLNFGGGMIAVRDEESMQEVYLAAFPIPPHRSETYRMVREAEQLARRVLLGPPLPSKRPQDDWLTAFDEAVRTTLAWDNTFEADCLNATVPDARYDLARQYMVKLAGEWPRSSRYRFLAERMTRELAAAQPQRAARLEWLGPWLDYNCVWILDGAQKDMLVAIGSKSEFGVLDDELVDKLRVADLDPKAKEHPSLPDWVSLQLVVELDGAATDGVFGKLDRQDIHGRTSYICDMWMTGPLFVSWWAKGQEPVQYVVWDTDQKSTWWGAGLPPDFETEPRPEDLMYAWEAQPVPHCVTLCDRIPAAERTKACEIANTIREVFRSKLADLNARQQEPRKGE